MFNRNMDVINLIRKAMFNSSGNNNYVFDFTNAIGVPIVLPSGEEKYTICPHYTANNNFIVLFYYRNSFMLSNASSSEYNLGTGTGYCSYGIMIHFGSNNTEPSKEDFNLKSNYICGTNYKQLSAEVSRYVDKGNDKIAFTLTSYNQAITKLSIKELGLSIGYADKYSSNPSHRILLSRDVLDTPLEVEAGKGFSLSISWEESLGLSKLGEITSVSGS